MPLTLLPPEIFTLICYHLALRPIPSEVFETGPLPVIPWCIVRSGTPGFAQILRNRFNDIIDTLYRNCVVSVAGRGALHSFLFRRSPISPVHGLRFLQVNTGIIFNDPEISWLRCSRVQLRSTIRIANRCPQLRALILELDMASTDDPAVLINRLYHHYLPQTRYILNLTSSQSFPHPSTLAYHGGAQFWSTTRAPHQPTYAIMRSVSFDHVCHPRCGINRAPNQLICFFCHDPCALPPVRCPRCRLISFCSQSCSRLSRLFINPPSQLPHDLCIEQPTPAQFPLLATVRQSDGVNTW